MATVLITGANKGIGLELTRIYASNDDTVIACCRNASGAVALSELAADKDIEIHEVQIGEDESVALLAEQLTGKPIDLLINNAGMQGPAPEQQSALNMDFDGWAEVLNINTLAPVRVMHALFENLKLASNPKVVTITSQMGALDLDMRFAYAYCTSKAALNKFMKMAALDLAKEEIEVCVIHPGWVKTDMGGQGADITASESADGIVSVINGLNIENSGSFWKWDGEIHAW